MSDRSLWIATAGGADYPPLREHLDVDTAIVGAGITGLTTALQLASAGRRVAVVEQGRVAASSTGNSTGNLYAPVSEGLSTIDRKWGDQALHQVVRSRQQAVDFIEQTIAAHAIDCGFVRRPWFLCAPAADGGDYATKLQSELQAALDAGLPASEDTRPPLPFATGPALRVDQQAQFNPYAYVQGLARVVTAMGVKLFEHSAVTAVDPAHGLVSTAGGRITAEHVVIASHTPKGLSLLHTELGVYREYGLALRLNSGSYPEGIFWMLGDGCTLRAYRAGDAEYLVVVGEKHKTGQADDADQRHARLERYARERFDVAAVTHRWSAQSYHAADGLPYIGPVDRAERLFVATGFATDGLVYGSVAGLLLGNLIEGKHEPLARLYRPRRFAPLQAAGKLTQENLNNAGQLLKDYLGGGEAGSLEQIPRGEGRLLQHHGERLAVYRDQDDQLQAVSAVCPHMGCLVRWNKAEASWDCPCHGSRFERDGRVIEGPALQPLPRRPLGSP